MTWGQMAETVRSIHTELGASVGGVIPPTLFPFSGGRMVGFVQLRPIYRGADAAQGITDMSYLGAVGKADEVLVAWETQDIAVACELTPLYADPGSPGGHWAP